MEGLIEKLEVAKYPVYKDSGVAWLGEIPEHWKVEKGKWLFFKNERPIRKDDGIITCFRDGEVTLRINRKTEGFTNALKEHGYQGIRKGDLVIHNMDAFAGAIGVSDSDGKSTPVYSVCSPLYLNTVNPYYYAYFLRDLAKSGYIQSLAKGIRERSSDFRFNDFGVLLISYPPLPEQTEIVNFLDRKTTLIDQAIAIKQKQIELLKERRQILIHKAVTRGLNPKVKLKDSGVEWIGEIPEGWEVVSNRNLYQERKESGNDSLMILSVSIHSGVSSEEQSSEENIRGAIRIEDKSSYKLVKPNDVVFNMMRAWQGGIGAVKVNGMVSPAYIVASPKVKISSDYFEYQYRTQDFIQQMDRSSRGITDFRKRLYWAEFKLINTIVPPFEDQLSIVEYIESLTKKISSATSLKEQEIEKLKEYKATLINSAVTGKIKVC